MLDKRMWNNKRYYSLDYYLKNRFGEKLYKLSLDGGMTCPNRDGKLSYGGCIFCSEGGSGDFSSNRTLSITQQINEAKTLISKKASNCGYIAYFQAFTNTYAPIEHLRKIFYEAIENPEIKVLAIATRPDCLPREVLELLRELNVIKPVFVELGLQTIHKKTELRINRGYPLSTFEEALDKLRNINIEVIVHTILGLPGETYEDIYETINYLAHKDIQGIKLQLLHILKGTKLSEDYDDVIYLSQDEYIDILLNCIERLPQTIIIHRITGDGPKPLLISPLWSKNKKAVLNSINKIMKERDSWQGKQYT